MSARRATLQTWFRGIGRAAGREQRVGPAAGLLQPGLGTQAHCPPKGPVRDTERGPRGRPGAVPALPCRENKQKQKNRFQGASVPQDRLFTPGLGWHSFYFMNWQCVYANILINRENRSPIYLIWGPPSLLEGVRKKAVLESNLFCWCWGLMTIAKDK